MALIELAGAALGGGGVTFIAGAFRDWLKARTDDRRADRDNDFKIEEHRDDLTLRLLDRAREDMAALRDEVTQLRPMVGRLAHLEEALDHVHALLHAESDEEIKAARRRARAFLRRMRPAPGDTIDQMQARISGRRIENDFVERE